MLLLQPVHHCLDRREVRTTFVGKSLLDLAHRAAAASPGHFHDPQLETAQTRAARHMLTTIVADLITYVVRMQVRRLVARFTAIANEKRRSVNQFAPASRASSSFSRRIIGSMSMPANSKC